MQRKDRVSKVTKILIKDLKGERIVYQNADDGKIVIPKDEIRNTYTKKKQNYTWSLAWRILVVMFIIDFSLFSYFKFYKKTGFIEGLNSWVISTRQFIHGKNTTNQIARFQQANINYQPRKISTYKKRKPT